MYIIFYIIDNAYNGKVKNCKLCSDYRKQKNVSKGILTITLPSYNEARLHFVVISRKPPLAVGKLQPIMNGHRFHAFSLRFGIFRKFSCQEV